LNNKFSAQGSSLGYYYQAIRGLSLIMEAESETKMFVEFNM